MKYLYCVKGEKYWEMAQYSMLSLLSNSSCAEVICIWDKNSYSLGKLVDFSSRVTFIEIDGTDPSFPSISYKSNCFRLLVERQYLNIADDEKIVIVDCDVLWHENPDSTIEHLSQYSLWAQITTPLNIFEYNPRRAPLSRFDCGYRTLWDARRNGVVFEDYSPYRINAGLFMIGWNDLSESFPLFVDFMRRMPVKQIRLSESILSNIFHSRGLIPHSFEADVYVKLRLPYMGKKRIKYSEAKSNKLLSRYFQLNSTSSVVILPESTTAGLSVGRKIATHYICPDQKSAMIDAAIAAGLSIR